MSRGLGDVYKRQLEGTLMHQALAGSDLEFTYDDMVELLQAAFVAGYAAKKRGPYSLSDNTYAQQQTSVEIAVRHLFHNIDIVDDGDDELITE